jgi:drug/metabolite transporter (DMT)-like permease
MRRETVQNVAMLGAAAVVYGAIFPVNRVAAEAGWPPLAFAFFQTFVGGAAIALYLTLRGHRPAVSRRHVLAYLVIGAFAMALPSALLMQAAGHVPATLLTLVLSLSPVLTLLFAILTKLERFRIRALLAVALGFAGVVLIASPWSHAMTSSATNWFLLALLVPTMFAVSNVAASLLRPPDTTSATMAAGILIGGGLVVLPVALATGFLLPPVVTPAAFWTVVFASAINAFTIVLFFEVVRRAGPTFFSLFNYVALPAGVLWSILAFGELPPPVFWLALAIMLAAVATALGGRRPAPG